MSTNIFRPIKFGKEVFHPKSYDKNSFVMDWTIEAGGKVPTHVHNHMDEHFLITEGEILFEANHGRILKKTGETYFVSKGTDHSVSNAINGRSGMTVTYSPCADVHRMFEILATLDESSPGSVMNMVKYFYLAPKLGLKEFSTPQPAIAMIIITGLVSVVGKLSGWNKLVDQFK
jgi:quercetin dioxygenase-like cupin family protein